MSPQTYTSFIKPTLIDITKSLVKGNFDRYKSFTNSLVKADKECGTLFKDESITVNCYQYMSRMKQINTGKPFVKQVWEIKNINSGKNHCNKQSTGEIIKSNENNSTYKAARL